MSDISLILDRFKLPIAVLLLGSVLIIGGLVVGSKSSDNPTSEDFPKESMVSPKQITVDVSGAVISPGVYKLPVDSRIKDAVTASGGLRKDASSEYISKYLNLAQKLVDGTKIYIPKEGESSVVNGLSSGAVVGTVAGVGTAQVNINSATQAELEALSGIGEVTAAKIIASRPYQKIEDLQTQKIVSKSVFEKIKDQIVVY